MKVQLKNKVAVVVAGLFLAQYSWAQERSVQVQQRRITPAVAATMSIEDQAKFRFLQMLRTNPEIGTAQINVTASQYSKDAASAAYYPKVSIGANASSSSTVSNRQSTDISVVQPIYTGGRLTAETKSAEAGGTLAEHQYDKTVQDVVLDAMLAHSNLTRVALLVDASRAAVRAVAELLALEEKRVELGGSGLTDAQFARARLAVTQDRLANYEGQFEEARATYFRYFGVYPQGYSLPELEVPRSMLPPDVDTAATKGLFANPEIRVAETRIVKARYDYNSENASLYPSVNVVGVQSYFGEPDPFTGRDSDSSVNLRLSYSAFSGGEQIARVNQAAATVETRRAQLAAAKLRVEESVRFQWGKWAAGEGRSRTLLAAQTDSLQVFKNRKRLRDFGRETVIVMLDAQVEYFNVLIAYINARFDQRDAGIRLVHAMGQMRPTPGNEGNWFADFFTEKTERARLDSSLKATEEIASSPSDEKIAERLGINVNARELQEAERFVLTPTQRLGILERIEKDQEVRGSVGERSLRPNLKSDRSLNPRFY